ncbi:MAG: class I SAM-dependent methyltransferase [Pirellulales bacterium]
MFSPDQYALLDFGHGRKLERFGEVVLDRPSPAAAEVSPGDPQLWETATAQFVSAGDTTAGCGQRGRWEPRAALPDQWTIEHPPLVFELRPTEFGHVGVFPEQADNWSWIAQRVSRFGSVASEGDPLGERPRVLNLFAYTGGSTHAAAAAGAAVVHIDAAKSTVAWARRNAELSGLSAAPVRWIADDALRFVAREQKRGSRYHGIILDPPSYGHGPKGEVWQLERDLPALLARCGALLAENAFVLLTCHSTGITPGELQRCLEESLHAARGNDVEAQDLFLIAADGRRLHSGLAARWTSA